MESNCNHFWEIDFETLDEDLPRWVCRCGATKRGAIPVVDLNALELDTLIDTNTQLKRIKQEIDFILASEFDNGNEGMRDAIIEMIKKEFDVR